MAGYAAGGALVWRGIRTDLETTMRQTMLIVVVLLATLSFASHAQDQRQAETLGLSLDKTISALLDYQKNVSNMADGNIPAAEADAAWQIAFATTNAMDAIERVSDHAQIYAVMIHPTDRDYMKGRMIVVAKFEIQRLDLQIQTINRRLARIKLPALLAEAQRLRDLIQQAQNQIRSAIPSS